MNAVMRWEVIHKRVCPPPRLPPFGRKQHFIRSAMRGMLALIGKAIVKEIAKVLVDVTAVKQELADRFKCITGCGVIRMGDNVSKAHARGRIRSREETA
jgi:hypothetical protein